MNRVYGVFRDLGDLGKGVYIDIKDELKEECIFIPLF